MNCDQLAICNERLQKLVRNSYFFFLWIALVGKFLLLFWRNKC